MRPNIVELQPYSSARDEYSGPDGIFLDANENSFGSTVEQPLNRYPDPLQQLLKQKIAGIKQVAPENIFLGNGSDEAIDLLIRVFCEPGEDNIVLCPPTYGMYEVCAGVNNVAVLKVPLTEAYDLNVPKVLEASRDNTKLLFLCSPNNPTGNCLSREAVRKVLEEFQGIVIIDEAYIDFVSHKSWLPELEKYPNLVILQTFSKAWGLANIRLGMALAHPEIVYTLTKVKYPYNVNGITQEITLRALQNSGKKDDMVRSILQARDYLQQRLSEITAVERIYPSDANFLLVKIKEARKVYLRLLKEKVIVRDRSAVTLCDDCLRITVGTPPQNDELLRCLKAIVLNL
jgi:histidinol-phosphate aminotransferase